MADDESAAETSVACFHAIGDIVSFVATIVTAPGADLMSDTASVVDMPWQS